MRLPGSANHVSLEDAQQNFAEFGSAERRHRGEGRPPLTDDTREQGWRALDPARDNIEEPQRGIDYGDSYPLSDTTVLLLLARNLLAAAGELTGSAARVGGRAAGNIRRRFSKPAEL